jgi:hypothetical protein
VLEGRRIDLFFAEENGVDGFRERSFGLGDGGFEALQQGGFGFAEEGNHLQKCSRCVKAATKPARIPTVGRSDLDFDGGEAKLAGGDGGFESGYDDCVKLGAGERLNAPQGIVEVHGVLIGTIGGDGVECIGDSDDASHQGNLWSGKAVGVAAAVHMFVMKFDARKHFF